MYMANQARSQGGAGGGGDLKKIFVCRRGSRIQKGGFVHSEGGGFIQEFQERIQIVAGPWANQQAKKKLQTAVGGVSDHPKKTPVSAPGVPLELLESKLFFPSL